MDKSNVIPFPGGRRFYPLHTVEDSIRAAVVEHYAGYKIQTIEKAIDAARIATRCGLSFTEAMDMADQTVKFEQPEKYLQDENNRRNAARLEHLETRRQRRLDCFLDTVCRFVRADMQGKPEAEILAAIERAKRIIMGGGTIGRAVYLATKTD